MTNAKMVMFSQDANRQDSSLIGVQDANHINALVLEVVDMLNIARDGLELHTGVNAPGCNNGIVVSVSTLQRHA